MTEALEKRRNRPARLDHRFSVAPMMDWTDRHCRWFHRLLAPEALLFTEMVTCGAILYGDRARLLDHDAAEHPVVLQLGGSEPEEMAAAVRAAEPWGYDGYNLNCGCPSDRVQRGRFGAGLMREPERVREVLAAMREATGREVSVKCRIGVDDSEDDAFLERFVASCAESGVETFIVHARKAWLAGLSPKENREKPPLRYDVVERLAARHPELRVVVNGGLRTPEGIGAARTWAHGVMVGRAAYQNPGALPTLVAAALDRPPARWDDAEVLATLGAYIEARRRDGVPAAAVLRHVLGLFQGRPGARRWRRTLSEGMRDADAGAALLDEAAAALLPRAA
ncbi:MAG: tRNA dihydrouridine(20/20a) synthase DusA [Alphaproteobacteria bacterium]